MIQLELEKILTGRGDNIAFIIVYFIIFKRREWMLAL